MSKTIHPYSIHHIDLYKQLDLPSISTANKGNYVVFWWQQMPLGQFFLEPGAALNERSYVERLVETISLAVKFYCSKHNVKEADWKGWILRKQIDELNAWFSVLFTIYVPAKMPAEVPVSVLICTRNRSEQLTNCLNMLQALSCRAQEIIVIDNAPVDDSTKAVVEKFKDVTYIREARAGLDIARNTGVKNAHCPLVAFVDDDVLVHPEWLFRVWETFEEPSTDAMTGLVIASELETEAQLIFETYWSFNRGYKDVYYDNNYFQKTLVKGPPVWEIGAGANMAFRRSVFDKAGLFNDLLDAGAAGCNGDSEMWFRILAKGSTIHYNPRAVVYHEHRRDMPGLKKQIFNYMRGFTTAVLVQQNLVPACNYKKYKLKGFFKHYLRVAIKNFPSYPFQLQTAWPEAKGILSGLMFYRKNKTRF
ncbi:MAG: glycosyltransferase [Bacteroidota bacterium]